jgi:peptidoglycan-associated lipoprotein
MFMTNVWIVNLITGVICIGIVSGCAVKSVNIEKVNKEMKESKEEHALDKSQSQNSSSGIETPSWIDEEMIDAKGVFNSFQKTQPLKNKLNPFSNPNVSGILKKEAETELFLADKLEDIFFGLDQYNIDKSAKEILIKHAEWLKKNPLLKVQLAGHCDERGTNNYNIALGTRRALNVRGQLAFMGISRDRLLPISYGEEKPSCRESTESCWSKNRRVRFLISSN